MARRVVWHRLAEEDLTAAYLHIGADAPDAAERLLDAIEESIQFLVENPYAGRTLNLESGRAQGMRSWIVGNFRSYLIFYRSDGSQLTLVRILHGARDLPRLLGDDA